MSSLPRSVMQDGNGNACLIFAVVVELKRKLFFVAIY